MGLGLPLLAAFSVSEFRAVLAHEFAHYYSGDTSLGPRIYSTRAAMARTLQNLSSDSVIKDVLSRFGIALLLHTVVVGMLLAYWKVFLRITQLVSRKQEHRSDELACYVAGSRSMAEGLKRINMMSAISRSFWPSVMNPVLSAGFRPPIADGFRRYYSAPPIERAASAFLQDLLDNPKTTAYDTHPPLKSRLDQIGRISVEGDFPSDNSPAISLLDDVDGLESRLLGFLLSGHEGTLRTVDWESTSSTVWLPLWRSYLNEHSASLAKYTLESIPSALKELPAIGSTMRDPPGTLLTREQRAERASDLICTALTVRLVDQGWELRMQPGEFSIVKGEAVASPPGLIRDLRAGKKSQDDWREWCRTNGLETVSLGQEASVAGPM